MNHAWNIRIIGIVLIIVGFFINYRIARRRFYRRSITGLERFKSFERSWVIRSLESLGRLAAKLFILAGLVCILVSFFEK